MLGPLKPLRIYNQARFRSYAKFKTNLDAYCREHTVAGVPLKFLRQSHKKLATNTFKDDPLDHETINRFVYHKLSLKCENHESITLNENGPFCSGSITLAYNRKKDSLIVTSFARHSNRCAAIQSEHENGRLNEIVKIARELPDDALALVEQVCNNIHENWDKDSNAGLAVQITPIKNERDVLAQFADELQSVESGIVSIFSPFSTNGWFGLCKNKFSKYLDGASQEVNSQMEYQPNHVPELVQPAYGDVDVLHTVNIKAEPISQDNSAYLHEDLADRQGSLNCHD